MEGNDSDIMDKLNSKPEKDYFDEKEYSPWDKNQKVKFGSKMFKVPEEIPFSWFGIVFLILIFLFILLFFRSGSSIDEKQIAALETRLKKLEDRTVKFEAVDERVTQIWEQAKSFEQFKERFDRSEASMTLRMDHIAKGMDSLQKNMAEARPRKVESSGPAKVSKQSAKQRYHTVRAGETLYGISRQYGLTLKKIQLLNKLAKGAVIRPGQKLLVGP
ncbi:MAG: hypothetical protein BBJ57_11295 [Desulfobacterales bacterium PC51MH44]|nr:MAG: hypothetical protein BBJ57_11295 [Desulfobacterales bacterium PC51MH44]